MCTSSLIFNFEQQTPGSPAPMAAGESNVMLLASAVSMQMEPAGIDGD